jgi:hypothetical protein
LVLNYHFLAFTEWVNDGFARKCMGFSMIALTISHIGINLLYAGFDTTSGFARAAKLHYLLYKAIKKRK